MQTNYKIRKANLNDIEWLVDFNMAMALETENRELSRSVLTRGVKSMLDNPEKGFYLLAEYEEWVVGTLMITYEWSDWRNGFFWWIQSVFVEKGFRKRGVYSALYQHVKNVADQSGNVCGFRLYVEQNNAIAKRAYERQGMVSTRYEMFEEDIS